MQAILHVSPGVKEAHGSRRIPAQACVLVYTVSSKLALGEGVAVRRGHLTCKRYVRGAVTRRRQATLTGRVFVRRKHFVCFAVGREAVPTQRSGLTVGGYAVGDLPDQRIVGQACRSTHTPLFL